MAEIAGTESVRSQEPGAFCGCLTFLGTGAQELEPSSLDFPGHKQGSGSEVEHLGLEPSSI